MEKCSEESAGPAYCEQSSSALEERQRHTLTASEDKPKLSCIRGKGPRHQSVHQCNSTTEKPFSCHKKNMKVCEKARAAEHEQNVDGKQSTSLSTEAELHQTKRPAPYQTVCRNTFIHSFTLQHYENMRTFIKKNVLSLVPLVQHQFKD